MSAALIPLTVFLKTQCLGQPTGLSLVGSTPIVVCDNHRIVNHLGELLSFCLTPGNVDDRKPVPDLVSNLTGWLYGDKIYISQNLVGSLAGLGLNLVNKARRNMKPKLLRAFDRVMLRKRVISESVNDQLKNISQIEHTRHRSPFNFSVNLIAGLIAYTRQPLKPHIDVDQLAGDFPMEV